VNQTPDNIENLPTVQVDRLPTEAYPFHQEPSAPTADVAALNLHQQNYEVRAPIGTGAMGAVLQVRDRNIDRTVAMKVVLDQHHATPQKLQRFLQEARILGQLEHPNIVPIHELGVDDQGRLYYTMKLLRGRPLREILERIRDGNAELAAQYPLSTLLTVFLKLCDAVAYAHSRGVIHRDLKPENVMVGDYGEVVLMDWGLAKRIREAETITPADGDLTNNSPSPVLTRDGMVLGTPHFMSPEQAAGRIQDIDERTDVFALGGILYNLLTLHPPFPGNSAHEVIQKARQAAVPPPTAYQTNGHQEPGVTPHPLPHCPGGRIPVTLATIAMKALAGDPSHRYQSASALAEDLRAYEAGFATSVEEKTLPRLLALMVKRRKAEFLFASLAGLMILTVGGVSLGRIVQSEKRARELVEQLRKSAPAYAAEAQGLVEQYKFEEALQRIENALSLDNRNAGYHALRGNILQTLLRMEPACQAYADALRLDPRHAEARENLRLCRQFIEDNRGRTIWLPASLNTLHSALLRQQRSAEALAIMRQFGPDKGVLYDSWKTILTQAGLRITTRNLHLDVRGLFTLNLQDSTLDDLSPLKDMPLDRLLLAGTKISDLTPLQGALLTELDLSGTKVSDLTPLTCMPLRILLLRDTRVSGLAPLANVPVQTLTLENTPVQDLTPLQDSNLKSLDLRGSLVEDLTPLRKLSLEELNLENTPVTDLTPLRNLPLRRLSLAGCARIQNLQPLAGCRQLEVLVLPSSTFEKDPVLKSLPNLRLVQTKPVGRGSWPAPPPPAKLARPG
jgi:serine/threonine protein kinase